ncbi:MAG: protein kinase [Gemmatimonadales bacterium]|nr:protein kinase [Gemmatimonadales bacterium]
MSDSTARLSAALADRYRLERELGAGGMATVYLAADLKHDRKVAIKVLKPELAAVLGAERFVQEIKTTAQLQHPHILPLFDPGCDSTPRLRPPGAGSGRRGPGTRSCCSHLDLGRSAPAPRRGSGRPSPPREARPS